MFAPRAEDGCTLLSRPLTVGTHQALHSVNQHMIQHTTYKDHFPRSPHGSTSQTHSLLASRCTSADARRGKYSRGVSFSYSLPPQQYEDQGRPSTTGSLKQELSRRLFSHRCISSAAFNREQESQMASDIQQSLSQFHEQEQVVSYLTKMVDQATQTEEWEDQDGEKMIQAEASEDDYWEEESTTEDKKHPDTIQTSVFPSDTMEPPFPSLSPPRPPSVESFLDTETSSSASTTPSLPFMDTSSPYSQTQARQKFLSQHPELLPDLREYSIKTGKRHTFSGYHAYYWH